MKFILLFQKTPLYIAVEKENIDIVKLLLMNDEIDVNLTNKSFYNFQENDYIKELVDEYDHYQKFDNNITAEKTSLYRAIEIGNIEIVKLLLMNRKIDVRL